MDSPQDNSAAALLDRDQPPVKDPLHEDSLAELIEFFLLLDRWDQEAKIC
jgi:hypothetical protein